MADKNGDITLLKKTSISVFVDEALPDILVVTYEFGLKIFKGVLLDSTKRNLPCGVPQLNPAFNVPKNPDDDPLYAVNQRFSYMDPATQKKKVQVPNKYKNNKMTVRLRPRQVLCSKCKGICNENSENVSKKRKASSESASSPPPPSNRRARDAPVTRSVKNYLSAKRKLRGYSQDEVEESSNKKSSKKNEKADEKEPVESPNWVDPDSIPTTKKPLSNIENEPQEDPLFIKHSEEHSPKSAAESTDQPVFQQPTQTQVLRAARRTRKKKSTGTTDDESSATTPEPQPANSASGANVTNTTRTIKISYGPQGEGTVLKIPAQIGYLI